MRSRRGRADPRVVIGVLVFVCAVLATVSVLATSETEDPTTSGAAAIDRSLLTDLHPRDGVPSIDAPVFEKVGSVDWLVPEEPVIQVAIGDVVRAYPLQIMMWHEIVNDSMDGRPIAVTYCPVCNTAIAFVRPTFDGEVTTFGTSGKLYRSNLLMYDRASDSLWPQMTGLAVSGPMIDEVLLRRPSPIVSWESFRTAFPKGEVLSRDTGVDRPYGENPYPGYDTDPTPTPEIDIEVDDRLAPMDRVLGLRAGGEVTAFAFKDLRSEAGGDDVGVVNDVVGGVPVVVIWKKGTVSALDAKRIENSRDVGSITAFARRAGERTLRFTVDGSRVTDRQTGSKWDVFGKAVDGPLRGESLPSVDTIEAFWFNWAGFHPKTSIR